MEGAKLALAQQGLDASYHQIARLAGLGVGTVYRCYPDRDELLAAVLLDILDGLSEKAEAAVASSDVRTSFARFFDELSKLMQRHAGLSQKLEQRGGQAVGAARKRLVDTVEQLVERAKDAGVRGDVTGTDVLFLAQATAVQGCGLDIQIADEHRARSVAIILAGMSASDAV